MRKQYRTVWFVMALFAITPTVMADETETPVPLERAHAHNDYHHKRPLFDALGHGFCSVEADIFLVVGKLLVGHEKTELKPTRTLQSLYLDPLRQRVKKNGGRVFRHGPDFTLLIDIKSNGPKTARALNNVLSQYADILTSVDKGHVKSNAVTVIVSGNRAWDVIGDASPRYAGIDGRLSDLKSNKPAALMPLVSDNWTRHFRWRGRGPMPAAQRKKLHALVALAHKGGHRLRFWRTPENERLWQELHTAGVDLIATDKLDRLATFLRARRLQQERLTLVYEDRQALPNFKINGRPAHLHTQGIWVTEKHFYVTGRLEGRPRRAMLVRFQRSNPANVETVDITPAVGTGGDIKLSGLDHPGGFDFDGRSFWIPLSASHRNSKSIILKFPHLPDQPLSKQKAVEAFRVDDHIGALAYDRRTNRLFGANWDTNTVYVWKPDGTLIERIEKNKLIESDPAQALAVQDWKSLGQGRVLAGGVDKSRTRPLSASKSVLALLDLKNRRRLAEVRLSSPPGRSVRLTHEGMALFGGDVFFLPGDLGSNAEVYRYRWVEASK